MFYLPAVMFPLKTFAPVLGKKVAVMAVAWGIEEMRRAVNRKIEEGEARDPVEALQMVVMEWVQWLKKGFNQGPAAEGA